jgi:hypothetical protein
MGVQLIEITFPEQAMGVRFTEPVFRAIPYGKNQDNIVPIFKYWEWSLFGLFAPRALRTAS